jgi:hypothetical protein
MQPCLAGVGSLVQAPKPGSCPFPGSLSWAALDGGCAQEDRDRVSSAWERKTGLPSAVLSVGSERPGGALKPCVSLWTWRSGLSPGQTGLLPLGKM